MVAVSTISPQQTLAFRQQRNDAKNKLLTSQAQNLYQRQLQNLAHKNRVRGFETQQNRAREALPTDFINRGVFRSGIYRDALQKYATDRLQGFNDLTMQNQLNLGGMSLQNRGFEDDYTRALAGSYGGEYAARADIASALRGIL
jgi:hypothetical protein